jgi:hypothetical protein
MAWFAAKSPIRDIERRWIEWEFDWLIGQFGDGALRGPMLLPTDDFFPGVYAGDESDVRHVVAIVADRMAVDSDSFDLEFGDTGGTLELRATGLRETTGAAGDYQIRNGRGLIGISETKVADPVGLVATISHELAHHRLVGEGRIEADRRDGEPLTDLATVLFGLGIFGANASRSFATTIRYDGNGTRWNGWRAGRLGYLTEPMWGYALAWCAMRRGEPEPAWLRYVDRNPRAFAKKCLRFLARSGAGV